MRKLLLAVTIALAGCAERPVVVLALTAPAPAPAPVVIVKPVPVTVAPWPDDPAASPPADNEPGRAWGDPL